MGTLSWILIFIVSMLFWNQEHMFGQNGRSFWSPLRETGFKFEGRRLVTRENLLYLGPVSGTFFLPFFCFYDLC